MTFFVWCLFQFREAQAAKKRNFWMVDALVECTLMGESTDNAHDLAAKKTKEAFGYEDTTVDG